LASAHTWETSRTLDGELDDLTVVRAARGHETACRALVERYQSRVFALVGRMLDPRGLGAQVEDVAQDIFLRAFQALKRFRPGGPAKLSTWILTIATRRSIDVIRSSGRELSWEAAPIQAVAPDADRALVGRKLLEAVGRLPVGYQAAFVLRVCHDLDYAEIAQVLDIELGTVKSRIARARQKLRSALGDAP
jgi:RNA polymerase sigma-70 factor, ECF subfamily